MRQLNLCDEWIDRTGMLIFAGIAGTLALLVGWGVTYKLMRLSRRTGRAPERMLAIGFGGMFCVGYPFAAISRAPGLGETYEGALILALGMMGIAAGQAAMSRFPAIVFRPAARWATALTVATTSVGLVACIGSVVAVTSAQTRAESVSTMQPWALALLASIWISFLWNTIESALYYRNMKKRMALGLADAATTHQFLLWALATGASVIEISVIGAVRASGLPVLAPLPMTVIATSCLIAASCWSLGFFMPDRYRSWLERRSKASPPLAS